jgi:hypothetical protein
MMMEAPRSSETLVLSTAIRCSIPEDGIPHSHRRENLKSFSINRLGSVAETYICC